MKNDQRSSLIDGFLENKILYSTTVGDSMYPLLRNRKDRIIVKLIEDKVHLLDVVLYQRATGVVILHRVIAIGKEHFYICGDNQYRIEKVTKGLVIGRLTGFFRGEKLYQTTHCKFVLYSVIWWLLFPLRRVFLFVKHKVNRGRI